MAHAETWHCPKCFAIVAINQPECPHFTCKCGYQYPPKEKK